MRLRALGRVLFVLVVVVATTVGFQALNTVANSGHSHCGHGIKSCDASQVGQPCDPNNLGIICSAQANGSYCCLAYAP